MQTGWNQQAIFQHSLSPAIGGFLSARVSQERFGHFFSTRSTASVAQNALIRFRKRDCLSHPDRHSNRKVTPWHLALFR